MSPPGLLPSKRPHSGSPPRRSSIPVDKEEEPNILISYSFPGGPIGQALYALALPSYDGGGPIVPPPHGEQKRDLYPILEIPADQCPGSMSCVKLKSRLYYLGGSSCEDNYMMSFPTNVYFLEIDDLYAGGSGGGGDTLSPAVLREGIPMNQGKPNCYAFVDDDKLYAIGESAYPGDIDQFEVFDPETGQWSSLPRPPFGYAVDGHARIGDKLIMSTRSQDISFGFPYYFDLSTLKWVEFHPENPFKAENLACFVGGCLYYHFRDNSYNIASFGPGECDFYGLFKTQSYASPEVSDAIEVGVDDIYSSRLLPLGNSKFLYLMGIKLPDPEYPGRTDSTDLEKDMLRVVVFEVIGERFYSGEKLLFRTKLLHKSEYIRRSMSGADAFGSGITGCFPGFVESPSF